VGKSNAQRVNRLIRAVRLIPRPEKRSFPKSFVICVIGEVSFKRGHFILNSVHSAEGVRKRVASQRIDTINHFSLFAEVPPADRQGIISAAGEKRFSRRETIFSEGNPVRDVTMLLSGCVKVTQTGLNGNEVILRLNAPGEIVGSFRVCTHCNHCSTAQTVQDSTALVWDASTFEKLLVRYPTFRRNTLRALEERLRDMEERFREVSTEKVGSRLSSELIRLSDRLGRTTAGQLEITLSRAELAQLIGTTLFTVSRLLCQWQTLGIVTIRREAVMVRDVNALAQLSHVE
jgi:CRP-like cAMP-binding protein